MIFIKKDLQPVRLTSTIKEAETLIIEINKENVGKFKIIAIYKPNKNNWLKFKKAKGRYFKKEKRENTVFIGDLNVNLFKNTNTRDRYLVKLTQYNFINTIYDYTREEKKGTSITRSSIDHAFINTKKYKINSMVLKYKIADHYPIMIKIEGNRKLDEKINKTKTKSKTNKEEVIKELKIIKWHEELNEETVEQNYAKGIQIINNIVEKNTRKQ